MYPTKRFEAQIFPLIIKLLKKKKKKKENKRRHINKFSNFKTYTSFFNFLFINKSVTYKLNHIEGQSMFYHIW